MSAAHAKAAPRRVGRPASGPRGERVSAYPQLTVRIPAATKDKLLALAALRKTPAWRLVDDALLAYVEALPEAERRLLAQFAVERGVTMIGLVRRERDVEELGAQGIPNLVATSADGWRDRVKELAGGSPIVAAVDSVGGESSGDLLELLGEGGTLVSFGAMGSDGMRLSSGDLIFKQAVVRGFWGSKVSASMAPEKRAELFGELIRAALSGAITLPVEEIFSFDQVRDAAEASARSGRRGKVLLRP